MQKAFAAREASLSSCPWLAERRGSLLTLAAAAQQLAALGGAGAELGAPGSDCAGGHCHLLLIIADAERAAVSHRAAHSLAGGGQAGAQWGAGDVPISVAGAQLARKVDVEGAAGRDMATGKALHLTVAFQVGGADAGWGAGGTAAPSSSSGWPLHIHLRAWSAGTGVTCGFWGSTTEHEAGERQAKGAIKSHASRRDRERERRAQA